MNSLPLSIPAPSRVAGLGAVLLGAVVLAPRGGDPTADPGAHVRLVGGLAGAKALWRGASPFEASGSRPHWKGVEAGAVTVDFPPVPELGQRGSQLQFEVPPGADVEVHAGYQPADSAGSGVLWSTGFEGGLEGLELGSESPWRAEGGRLVHGATPEGAGGEASWHQALVREDAVESSDAWTDYYLAVDCGATAGPHGLLFRYTGPADWYRLAVDPASGTLVLSRSVGGQEFVIRKGELPRSTMPRRLAVQADGFGIEVFVDHALVLREMDGAHDRGRVGVCASPSTEVWFDTLEVTRPVRPVPAAVTVRTPGRLSIHGVRPAGAGKEYWLAMTTPSLPVIKLLDRDGLPPFVIVPADVGWFAVGRHIHRYTRGTLGILGNDGGFRARIEWPDHPALRYQAFGVTGWTVDAEGGAARW